MTPREIADEFIVATDWFDVTKQDRQRLEQIIADVRELVIVLLPDDEIVSQVTT